MGRFSLYWYGQSTGSKLLHLLLAIIVLALIASWLLPTPAQADGYSSYKDDISETRYSRQSDVRNYLTASEKRELRRIHQRAVARRDGRRIARDYDDRPRKRLALRYEDPAPVRYVERKNVPSSLYAHLGDRECRAAIEVSGHERLGRGRAEQSAYNAWRTRAQDVHGFKWSNIDDAMGVKLDCAKIRGNTFGVYVCGLRAKPCRGRP